MMRTFQCSDKHRWQSELSDRCPECSKLSEDLVAIMVDEMCPCCGVRGGIWGGVNHINYCDHCNFKWDVNLSQIDRLQKILDFKKQFKEK